MEHLPIGVVAARSGMASSALRYYEDQGLLPPAVRTPGGARRYPRTVLRRLAVIRAARNVGLSLPDIRTALATLPEIRTALATLPQDRPPTVQDWAQLSRDWRNRLEEQIAALTELRDGLTSCIGCGCLSLARCALINPGDVAATEGPGARRLPPALRRPTPSG